MTEYVDHSRFEVKGRLTAGSDGAVAERRFTTSVFGQGRALKQGAWNLLSAGAAQG